MQDSAWALAGAAASPEQTHTFVGNRIREIRKRQGRSIPNIAKAAGLSNGLISQIERGLTSPSIRSMRQIADALDVSVQQFFTPASDDCDEPSYVVRPSARRFLDLSRNGIYTEITSPAASSGLQTFIANIMPSGHSGHEFDSHKGEEAGLILSGQLELWVGDNHFLLDEGCSFNFPSTTPHRYSNPGLVPTRVHWIITPPIY